MKTADIWCGKAVWRSEEIAGFGRGVTMWSNAVTQSFSLFAIHSVQSRFMGNILCSGYCGGSR